MFKLFSSFYPLMSPEDEGGAPSGKGIDDAIKFMSEEDEDEAEVIPLDKPKTKTTPKEDEDDKDEDESDEGEEEEDELAEIEKELEGPSEEQLELVTPVRRRDILKKYPQLFKDFPYLETAYYREQQFTEVYPTIKDAKEASEKAETLDRFERDIMGGNTETILQTVKKQDPQTFNKIVDNYLITLHKVDANAYLHVIGNTIKQTIATMVGEARRTENKELEQAALIVNQFTFGTSEYTPPQKLAKTTPENNEAEEKVRTKELAFTQKQFETTRDDLNNRVSNSLRATIEANIDPRDSMSDYVKKNASREAMEMVTDLVQKDTRFKNLLDKLWESAFEKNFDKPSTDKIRAAYLSKAKTLLPSVIKKARNDALKGTGKKVRDTDDDNDSKDTRPIRQAQRDKETPSSQNRQDRDGRKTGKITNAKDIPAGMRSIDFLMQD